MKLPEVPIGLGLVALAVAIRVNNAVRYPADWGFDARFIWEYIVWMRRHWALPAADLGWSASEPPLYFATAAAWIEISGGYRPALLVPLLSLLTGLAQVAAAWLFARRVDPGDPTRAGLAALLLLYLPAHLQMSAMVNEEMLLCLLATLALSALALRRPEGGGPGEAARAGLWAGLALLTKLTGALLAVCGALTYALDGLRRRDAAPTLRRIAVFAGVVAAVGGWYYLRNWIQLGSLWPFGLEVHEIMFSMPPGERSLLDYVYVPLATWTDPQLLHPDLLRSVWGSTYATLWFDGHRFFLPAESVAVDRLGTLTLLLALVPSAAFAVGLLRGAGRAWHSPLGPDAPLLLLSAAALAGYALYTWRNPWFAAVKGTSLLVVALPYAHYASGELARGLRGRGAPWLLAALLALAAAVSAGSAYDVLFEKREVSGLPWKMEP